MTKHTEKGRRLAAAIAAGRKPSGTLPAALRREVGDLAGAQVSMGTIDRWLS